MVIKRLWALGTLVRFPAEVVNVNEVAKCRESSKNPPEQLRQVKIIRGLRAEGHVGVEKHTNRPQYQEFMV